MSDTIVGCHLCGRVQPYVSHACLSCGEPVHPRTERSLQRCWSMLLTGLVFYIPANILPMMRTIQVGGTEDSTIAAGVVMLWEHGSYLVGAIIFLFSLLLPLAKFVAITALALAQHNDSLMPPRSALTLYRVTEFVGRWSMMDVFVVGFLAALIQMGSLMTIVPGPAALAFAAMVICTMIAANSLDPRVYWDRTEENHV